MNGGSMPAMAVQWQRRKPDDVRGGPVRVLRAYRALARFDRLLAEIATRADWHHVRFDGGTYAGLAPHDEMIAAIDLAVTTLRKRHREMEDLAPGLMALVARDPSTPFVMRPEYGESARYPSAVHVLRQVLKEQVRKKLTSARARTFFTRVTEGRRLVLKRILEDREFGLLQEAFTDPTGYDLAQLRRGVFEDALRARQRLRGPRGTVAAFWRVHDDRFVEEGPVRDISEGSLELLRVLVPAFPDAVSDAGVFEKIWPTEWGDDESAEAERRLGRRLKTRVGELNLEIKEFPGKPRVRRSRGSERSGYRFEVDASYFEKTGTTADQR